MHWPVELQGYFQLLQQGLELGLFPRERGSECQQPSQSTAVWRGLPREWN